MNRNVHQFVRHMLPLLLLALLSACASTGTTSSLQSFDFGMPAAKSDSVQLDLRSLKISLSDIRTPINLEGQAMLYRLQFDNAQEIRSYAQSRWSMPPAQLLAQRIKEQINAHGGVVLNASDGIRELAQMRIELEEFAQHFSTPNNSQAQVRLRVSLVRDNKLLAQNAFSARATSNSPDAKGGAKAMPIAVDLIIADLLTWLKNQSSATAK